MTYGIALLLERFQECPKQLIGIINLLGVLSDNPNQGGLCLWFIQLLQVRTQSRNDALVVMGVSSEDILSVSSV
jgi:hypothetical protein